MTDVGKHRPREPEEERADSAAPASARLPLTRMGGWLAPLLLLVACFVGAIVYQYTITREKVRVNPPYYGVEITIDDGDRLIPLSVGYRLPLADLLFMQSIQSFGGMWRYTKQYDPIFNLFFVMTDVDPWFVEAYKFGSLVIGDEGGDHDRGVELLHKGMVENPNNYRLPYEAAYCIIYQMKRTPENRKRALFYVNQALKTDDCPEYVRRLRDEILTESGDHMPAIRHSLYGHLESLDSREWVVAGIYRRRLLATVYQWQQDQLIEGALAFKKNRGRDVTSIAEIFSDPDFAYRTIDFNRLTQAIDEYRGKSGELVDYGEQILNASVIRTRRPPVDVRVLEEDRDLPPYVVRAGYIAEERRNFIMSLDDAKEKMRRVLSAVRFYLRERWMGEKQLPERFEEVVPPGYLVPIEPFGGEWVYDPDLMTVADERLKPAVFRSSTFPLL